MKTRDERSLLLFFEDMAVNQYGWIDDVRKLNKKDLNIAKQWDEKGFVLFKRASRQSHKTDARGDGRNRIELTYVVKLSDEAWKKAHKLRKERALRNIPEQFGDKL